MISALIREFLLPLLLFLFLRSVLRNLFASFRKPVRRSPQASQSPQPPHVRTGGVLHKDPVCGTYVSDDSSITYTVNGQVMHFCSRECSEKYRGG
jgi:YHS domain-containing protein